MAQRNNFYVIPKRPEVKSSPFQFQQPEPTVSGFRNGPTQPQHSSVIYGVPKSPKSPPVLERYPPGATQLSYAQNGQQPSRKFGAGQPPPLAPSSYYREEAPPGRNFMTLPINRTTGRTPLPFSGNTNNVRSVPNSPQPVKAPTSYYRTYSHSPFSTGQRSTPVLDKYPSVLTLNDVTITPVPGITATRPGRYSTPAIPSVLDRYPPAAGEYYQNSTRNSAPASGSSNLSLAPAPPTPGARIKRSTPVDDSFVPNRFRYPASPVTPKQTSPNFDYASPNRTPNFDYASPNRNQNSNFDYAAMNRPTRSSNDYAVPQIKTPQQVMTAKRMGYDSPGLQPPPPPPPPIIQPTQIHVPAGIPAPPKRTPSNASTFVRKASLKVKRNGSTASVKVTQPQPPVPRRKAPPPNHSSMLLNDHENQLVFQILGHGRQTLSTAVVQLLFPLDEYDYDEAWSLQAVTVLCFVRDPAKKSYFLEFISPEAGCCIYSFEIYEEFNYKTYRNSRFITFETDTSFVGVNFADEEEYLDFKDTLDKKIEARRQRRHDRQSKVELNGSYDTANGQRFDAGYTASEQANVLTKEPKKSRFFGRKSSNAKSKKDKKPKKLDKRDIGAPSDFTHVSHAGFDPQHGFQTYGDIDFTKYQAVFQEAKISAKELNDPATRKFIYQFVENYEKDSLQPDSNSAATPPPPPMQNQYVPASPSVPQRSRMPQPDPEPEPDYHPVEKQKVPPPPPLRAHASPKMAPPPPPPAQGRPAANIPPPPPMPPTEATSPPSPNAASPTKQKVPFIPEADYDKRSNLMKEIQQGAKGKLKPVDETQRIGTISKGSALDGMAEALQRALADRSRAINPDSSDSDPDSDAFDSGEWEDE